MGLFDRFSKQPDDDIVVFPSQASDDELLAWSTTLQNIPERPLRRAPLKAAPRR